ncbi:MAG: FAD-binding oxidoreductase [Flavobacteriales bacterium]|nr:FAD-binding oxidoreductase [Flavobacteriales bacterium]MCB9167904.1 FAD-binding oxidoreductase [Flavobacteriales bacterium]
MGTVSVWSQRSFPEKADLVVVGAGIVGLFTALFHKRRFPAHRVLLLEQGALPDGATTRNAGFACFGSPSELLADIAAEGEAVALARVEERWRGLRELRTELGDGPIGFIPCGGNEVFLHDDLYTRTATGFDHLNDLLKGIFGRPVFTWKDDLTTRMGLRFDHLAHTELEGALDSGGLATRLLSLTRAGCVEVRTRIAVERLEESADRMMVECANGERIMAERVVVATNGWARQLLPDIDVHPARGQVLVTGPLHGTIPQGTFHAEEGFIYFRDLGDRILLGGARNLDISGETTLDDATTPMVQEHLERFLSDRILTGHTYTIEHRWSGTMGFGTGTKSPLVERISDRVVAAVRLSGMGVAIGIRVARKAADLLDGRA